MPKKTEKTVTPEEYLKDKKVMFATPCYGGSCGEPYMRSMIELVGFLAKANVAYSVVTLVNESLITRARNKLVKIFLDDPEATHLFFIDSDIRFDFRDPLKMVLHDKDVVAGTYPMKIFNVDNLVGKTFEDVDSIRRATAKYVTNFIFESEEAASRGELRMVDNLVEVLDSGTGFMCIKREVIERMVEAHPETEYQPEGEEGTCHALFDTMIDDNRRYLSEDYTFCRRWQRMGGKVWLDPRVVLDHFGSIVYMGQRLFDIDG